MTNEYAIQIVGNIYLNCKGLTDAEVEAWQTLKSAVLSTTPNSKNTPCPNCGEVKTHSLGEICAACHTER